MTTKWAWPFKPQTVLLRHLARIDRMFASVGGRGRSQMTPGVPAGENRIKLPKSASSVTRMRLVSIANRVTSSSVFPVRPAAWQFHESTLSDTGRVAQVFASRFAVLVNSLRPIGSLVYRGNSCEAHREGAKITSARLTMPTTIEASLGGPIAADISASFLALSSCCVCQ